MTRVPLHQPRLILGSASPRRAALMQQLQLPFEQIVSPDAEPVPQGHQPGDFVIESASAKARAVARVAGADPGTLIIGADTVVVLDDQIAGKPESTDDAARMLRHLSGRTHTVFTGISLLQGRGPELSGYELTRVTVRPLCEDDISWYVASGEPMDKAGAYGIQGLGARFIERIDGCYYNVVGLPLARLSAMLETAGYRFLHPDHQPLSADD
jgi:septum formation protein